MRINFGNFEIVPVKEVQNIEAMVGDLGCCVSTLPMKYLGYILVQHLKRYLFGIPFWIVCKEDLAGWKKLYLFKTKSGRLTLIKSTLSSLPTYFMSLFLSSSGCGKKNGETPKRLPLAWIGGGF